mgnify:FL=1
MIYYVMVFSTMLTPMGSSDWTYAGHFTNCTQAYQFVKKNHPEATSTRCMLEEYIYMPKDLEYKYHI